MGSRIAGSGVVSFFAPWLRRFAGRQLAGRCPEVERLTIIVNDLPYGTEELYNALRYASALAAGGFSVNLFLLADGVLAGEAG